VTRTDDRREAFDVWIRDLASESAYIATPVTLEVGTNVLFRVFVPFGDSVDMGGNVVRVASRSEEPGAAVNVGSLPPRLMLALGL
jgi:hypothetical protein